MQTQRTFFEDLKHQYKYGGMTMKLIFANVFVFLLIKIIDVFSNLSGAAENAFLIIGKIFALNTNFVEFITHPWTLFTNMFAHYSLWHVLFNMIFLYFTGRMFEQLFDRKRLLYTYILAGIGGGLLEIIAHQVFPMLQITNSSVIGASGAIMGIFMAVAFFRPNTKVMLFGIFPVRLIWLAVGFLLLDFFALGRNDGTAHFAHLGGAIVGFISIQSMHKSTNIINLTHKMVDAISSIFSRKRRGNLKVKKGGGSKRPKSDEQYNMDAKTRQEQTDKILDKISKSGYESLSKKEKDFLFKQSKNG